MGTPDNTDTHNQDFATKVSDAVKVLSKDTNAEGLSEEVKFAATAEMRRRDTQASYTKSQQENAALKAEKAELISITNNNVNLGLTETQQDELEEVKFSDPDEYRRKMNAYESEAQAKHNVELTEKLQGISETSSKTAELEQRTQTLANFQEVNPDFELSDDILANDVPPRITRKLEEGTISFEGFLQEVHTYLKKGKVVADVDTKTQPNLSKVGGGTTPDEAAANQHSKTSYKNEVY